MRIDMHVQVDEARRDEMACRVDGHAGLAPCSRIEQRRDFSALDGDIAISREALRGIDDLSASDQDVKHRSLLPI